MNEATCTTYLKCYGDKKGGLTSKQSKPIIVPKVLVTMLDLSRSRAESQNRESQGQGTTYPVREDPGNQVRLWFINFPSGRRRRSVHGNGLRSPVRGSLAIVVEIEDHKDPFVTICQGSAKDIFPAGMVMKEDIKTC